MCNRSEALHGTGGRAACVCPRDVLEIPLGTFGGSWRGWPQGRPAGSPVPSDPHVPLLAVQESLRIPYFRIWHSGIPLESLRGL